MATLRILTLNCWNVMEPFDPRMELVRRGIEALKPDVIGLQEIIVRRDGFDQAAQIFDGLGYHHEFGAAMCFNRQASGLPIDTDGDSFGNLVASRWPIVRSAVRALPGVESGERRGAIAATIETPYGDLPFVCTHLNWKCHHGYVRERQVVALANFVTDWALAAALPAVFVGDMNADPDAAEVRFLCGLQTLGGQSVYFQDAWRIAGAGGPGFTWDNRNFYARLGFEPDRRIDYVFVAPGDGSGRGWIESVRVVFDQPSDGVFPSDHFGVLAEVRV